MAGGAAGAAGGAAGGGWAPVEQSNEDQILAARMEQAQRDEQHAMRMGEAGLLEGGRSRVLNPLSDRENLRAIETARAYAATMGEFQPIGGAAGPPAIVDEPVVDPNTPGSQAERERIIRERRLERERIREEEAQRIREDRAPSRRRPEDSPPVKIRRKGG